MSEIRDRVIAELRSASFGEGQINYVLGMREIAIVDREARMPQSLLGYSKPGVGGGSLSANKLQEAGYVKELLND